MGVLLLAITIQIALGCFEHISAELCDFWTDSTSSLHWYYGFSNPLFSLCFVFFFPSIHSWTKSQHLPLSLSAAIPKRWLWSFLLKANTKSVSPSTPLMFPRCSSQLVNSVSWALVPLCCSLWLWDLHTSANIARVCASSVVSLFPNGSAYCRALFFHTLANGTGTINLSWFNWLK